ncbi:hypothetical protein MSBR3_1098 [Methanosarcina barkeri 3]|uniref:Uncharacterized protein n=1 Tax=Methanosarcina barkeri 3 TaxID=1434107 RepID=A0A0E3SJA9_METBA|nr:hypothetical protein [Methanosarcina barkeri]AKB81676.1 hypothetical protein MSBR3_1098 [Methanosarcina barkeri 3]
MDYNLTITIDEDSLRDLHNNLFKLYVFKGSIVDNGKGAPLVWQCYGSKEYHSGSIIGWNEKYSAFISTQEIADKTTFVSESTKDILLGRKVTIDSSGTLSQPSDGQPGCIQINNSTADTDYTCGICQQDGNSKMVPMCAFPVLRGTQDTIIPIEKIAIYFATETINTGSVKESAAGKGIVIDLTDLKNRTASYALGKGWKVEDGGEGVTFEPNADLSSLLITVKSTAEIKKLAQERIARKI